jgi:hypothetical protein
VTLRAAHAVIGFRKLRFDSREVSYVRRLAVFAVLVVVAGAAAQGGRAAAAPDHFTVTSPLDYVAFLPCANGGAGELVHFTGSSTSTITIVRDPTGTYHLQVTNRPDAVGVGLTTGATYRTVGTGTVGNGTYLSLRAAQTSRSISSFNVIEEGSGLVSSFRMEVVLVVSATGEVTADVVRIESVC